MRFFLEMSYVHETIRYYFLNPPHCLTNFVRSNINIILHKRKKCDLSSTEMAAEDLAGILAYNSIDGATCHYREHEFSWRKTTSQWANYLDSM